MGFFFNAIVQQYKFQLYRGGQFYWWRKREYPEKTTDWPQVSDKFLSHYNVLICYIEYISPWAGFELTLVVTGTDCICSCKSNYHKITATTAPFILK